MKQGKTLTVATELASRGTAVVLAPESRDWNEWKGYADAIRRQTHFYGFPHEIEVRPFRKPEDYLSLASTVKSVPDLSVLCLPFMAGNTDLLRRNLLKARAIAKQPFHVVLVSRKEPAFRTVEPLVNPKTATRFITPRCLDFWRAEPHGTLRETRNAVSQEAPVDFIADEVVRATHEIPEMASFVSRLRVAPRELTDDLPSGLNIIDRYFRIWYTNRKEMELARNNNEPNTAVGHVCWSFYHGHEWSHPCPDCPAAIMMHGSVVPNVGLPARLAPMRLNRGELVWASISVTPILSSFTMPGQGTGLVIGTIENTNRLPMSDSVTVDTLLMSLVKLGYGRVHVYEAVKDGEVKALRLKSCIPKGDSGTTASILTRRDPRFAPISAASASSQVRHKFWMLDADPDETGAKDHPHISRGGGFPGQSGDVWLDMALVVDGELVGMLSIGNGQYWKRPLTRKTPLLLADFADRLAHRLALEVKEQEQIDDSHALRVLNQAISAMPTVKSPRDLYPFMREHLRKFLPGGQDSTINAMTIREVVTSGHRSVLVKVPSDTEGDYTRYAEDTIEVQEQSEYVAVAAYKSAQESKGGRCVLYEGDGELWQKWQGRLDGIVRNTPKGFDSTKLRRSLEAVRLLASYSPNVKTPLCVLSLQATSIALPTRSLDRFLQLMTAIAEETIRVGKFKQAVTECLFSVLSQAEPFTAEHCRRVSELCKLLAVELRRVATVPPTGANARASEWNCLDPEEAWRAGRLHDIGKLGVLEEVLYKNMRPNTAQYEFLKAHPSVGARMISPIPEMATVARAIEEHHLYVRESAVKDCKEEAIAGIASYPLGLAIVRGFQDGIMRTDLYARIVAVVDVFDARMWPRPYVKYGVQKDACEAILVAMVNETQKGQQNGAVPFDDAILTVFQDYVSANQEELRDKLHLLPRGT